MTDISLPTKMGKIASPFEQVSFAQMKSYEIVGWAGYRTAATYEDIVTEYGALRNQCGVIDISPMHKYRIIGKDALDFCNKIMTRDITKLAVNRVFYSIWCDERGMIIDDGTLFRVAEQEFWLCCQEPQFSWLTLNKSGFEVEISDITEAIPALAIQGPTSFAVLSNAGYDIEHLKPFGIWHGKGVMISRTGFTGDLGYEIWCLEGTNHCEIWQNLFEAGKHLGIAPVGMQALDLTRIEAGFLAVNIDIMGSRFASKLNRARTPWEAGLGWLIPKEKEFYNGMNAIKKSKNSMRCALIPVDIEFNKNAAKSLIYYNKKEWIGHITSALWSPTLKRNVGYAEIKAPYFEEKYLHKIFAEVYHESEGQFIPIWAKLTPCEKPFFNPKRKTQTPPSRF